MAMRLVIQRVSRACVTVNKREVGAIEKGLAVLVGIHETDERADAVCKCVDWRSNKRARKNSALTEGTISRSHRRCYSCERGTGCARKLCSIRLWPNDDGSKHWHESVASKDLDLLLVSQFTLHAVLKGNKPDFHYAM